MKLPVYFLAVILLAAFQSCKVIHDTSKYEFKDGIYKAKIENQKPAKAYIEVTEDSLEIFPLDKSLGKDSSHVFSIAFPSNKLPGAFARYDFIKSSIDLDVLTILFKYRPSIGTLPNQLNTNLNGAVYFGFRSDRYSLNYLKTAINNYKKSITHYGYSVGVFTGLGATAINPWVTNNLIDLEYDGVVIPSGIAAILGINNISFGLSIGVDYLIDRNNSKWIYQGKPWAGLVVGLNLN